MVFIFSSDNSTSNASDSGSVLSQIFQKPKPCMIISTRSTSKDDTPNHEKSHLNVNSDDTVVCKKKSFKFSSQGNANSSNLFADSPNSLCESILREPKRKKKCANAADPIGMSISAQFSICDTSESTVSLPKKLFAKKSAARRNAASKSLSLFEKTESSILSHTIPLALGHSVTSDAENSILLKKKKSILKASKRFPDSNLFESEPSSVCESLSKNKTAKRFRNDSVHHPSVLHGQNKFSHVSDEELNKENFNFDNTVSSVCDSVTKKQGGGFLNLFKNAKNSTANASLDIFTHPEGLSDDCESSSESEESEKSLLFLNSVIRVAL